MVLSVCIALSAMAQMDSSSINSSLTAPSNTIETTLQLSEPLILAGQPSRGYVQLTLNGIERSRITRATAANYQLPKRNVAIVVDISEPLANSVPSNSFEGQSPNPLLNQAQALVELKQHLNAALQTVGQQLQTGDSLSVMAFNGAVQEWMPATTIRSTAQIPLMMEVLERSIAEWQPGSSTALFAELAKAQAQLQRNADSQSITKMIVISNSPKQSGTQAVPSFAQLARSMALEGISITTIGLSLQHREDVLNVLARESDGYYLFLQDSRYLATALQREWDDMQAVVASDIEVVLRCAPGVEPLRLLGREGDIVGQEVNVHITQLLADQAAVVLLEVALPAQAAGFTQVVAAANIAYQQPHSQQFRLVDRSVSLTYTDKPYQVATNRNADVLSAVSVLTYSELTKTAVQQLDAGQEVNATQILQQADALRSRATEVYRQKTLPATVNISEAKAISEKLADEVERNSAIQFDEGAGVEQNWRLRRKKLTEEQFNLDTQQSPKTKQLKQQQREPPATQQYDQSHKAGVK